MEIMGLVGPSGVGKTTLLVGLVRALAGRGFTVSTIKHAHDEFDIDQPGKDSFRHRQAGAREVLVASAQRWALMRELGGAPEPSLEQLARQITPVDILLVEGFEAHAHNKIAVWRSGCAEPATWLTDPSVIAIASDRPIPQARLPVLPLDQPDIIAEFVLSRCGFFTAAAQPSLDVRQYAVAANGQHG